MSDGRYLEFLASKGRSVVPAGLAAPAAGRDWLFPFQSALVSWALRRGRAAVFADTGLGKTRIELAFARETAEQAGGRVLIVAPLAHSRQAYHSTDACANLDAAGTRYNVRTRMEASS